MPERGSLRRSNTDPINSSGDTGPKFIAQYSEEQVIEEFWEQTNEKPFESIEPIDEPTDYAVEEAVEEAIQNPVQEPKKRLSKQSIETKISLPLHVQPESKSTGGGSPTTRTVFNHVPLHLQRPYPPKELGRPHIERRSSRLCTQICLLFIALGPLLIIPAFCVVVILSLWIPEDLSKDPSMLHQTAQVTAPLRLLSTSQEIDPMQTTSTVAENGTVASERAQISTLSGMGTTVPVIRTTPQEVGAVPTTMVTMMSPKIPDEQAQNVFPTEIDSAFGALTPQEFRTIPSPGVISDSTRVADDGEAGGNTVMRPQGVGTILTPSAIPASADVPNEQTQYIVSSVLDINVGVIPPQDARIRPTPIFKTPNHVTPGAA